MTDQLAWAMVILFSVGFLAAMTYSLGWRGVLGIIGMLAACFLFAIALVHLATR